MSEETFAQATGLYVASFFDELVRWGVRDVVISPGSRSTALSMVALELSKRPEVGVSVYVDIDERGASFLALGMAKASGRPVALVCTSGTALANYYPAVIEAETSRVPLIVLSGDRPLSLQGMGAPQTCDQLKAYGDHVRAFQMMPLPASDAKSIAFARQAARRACLAALGPKGTAIAQASRTKRSDGCQVASRGCAACGGPVQVNFQFEEPLKPDLSVPDLFERGRNHDEAVAPLGPVLTADAALRPFDAMRVLGMLASGQAVVLAGEGTCETQREARMVLDWARELQLPVLADPLSGLRSFDDELVIDNYDSVFRHGGCPIPQVVIRFGRYPVSKSCTQALTAAQPINIVVDAAELRDFTLATSLYVPVTPQEFASSFFDEEASELHAVVREKLADMSDACAAQREFAQAWIACNNAQRERICAVDDVESGVEGAFVRALLELIPAGSCLFSSSSMPIRALDTFYVKEAKPLAMLCNRGQNGIDGTVSTAIGVAQKFKQTTFLTGDFTMLHDMNALALQREVLRHHGGEQAPSLVVVLMNNNGGAIFDMLPQQSEEDYFERLFLVPQDVDFSHAAAAFSVPFERVQTVNEFRAAYAGFLGTPGISFIEVTLPLAGVKERYGHYW